MFEVCKKVDKFAKKLRSLQKCWKYAKMLEVCKNVEKFAKKVEKFAKSTVCSM